MMRGNEQREIFRHDSDRADFVRRLADLLSETEPACFARFRLSKRRSSITAIYYKATGESFQMFFKNAITQDITGGWRSNRAKKVATAFCGLVRCEPRPVS